MPVIYSYIEDATLDFKEVDKPAVWFYLGSAERPP